MATRARLNPTERAERRKAQAEALHDQLAAAVDQLAADDQWQAWLEFIAAFHSYSLRNGLLILSQQPSATFVAGFNQWKDRGRQVRKGEKAIRIFGYSTKKITRRDPDTDEESETRQARFPILSVFDISQTDPIDGHPLAHATEDRPHAELLTGDDPTGIAARLTAYLIAEGWTVTTETITNSANGYTTRDGSRRVVVGDHLEPAAHTKTLIHEAAHALMHTADELPENYHRGTLEVEAESVAYVLAAMHGLDTTGYSVPYIAGWSRDPDEIRATADRVLTTVRRLATHLDSTPEAIAS